MILLKTQELTVWIDDTSQKSGTNRVAYTLNFLDYELFIKKLARATK